MADWITTSASGFLKKADYSEKPFAIVDKVLPNGDLEAYTIDGFKILVQVQK